MSTTRASGISMGSFVVVVLIMISGEITVVVFPA